MKVIDIENYKKNSEKFKTKANIKTLRKITRIGFLIYIVCYFSFNINAFMPNELSRNFSYILNIDTLNTDNIDLEVSRNDKIYSFNAGFVVSYPDILSFYSASGRELLELPLLYANPVLRIGNSKVLAYNSNSYEYVITSSFSSDTYEGKNDARIINASINSDDEYILVTDEDGYVSGVKLFNAQNELIFKASSSSQNIISAKSKGNTLASLSFSRENNEFNSNILIYDINSGELDAKVPLGTSFPLDLHILDNSNILVIFEDSIMILNNNGDIKETILTPDLFAYNVTLGNNIVYAEKSFSGNTDVTILSESGREVAKKSLPLDILDMEIRSESLFILTKNFIYEYDFDLNEKNITKNSYGAFDILVHSNGDIYGVSINKLSTLDGLLD